MTQNKRHCETCNDTGVMEVAVKDRFGKFLYRTEAPCTDCVLWRKP